MITVDLRALIGKLNDTTRRSLEAATGLCLSRTHYDVEVEHWLLKLLEQTDTDLLAILNHFGVDLTRLSTHLTKALDGFKSGNSRPPALSPRLIDMAREGWVLASLEFGSAQLGSGHLLSALVSDDGLARFARGISAEFEKISAEKLRKELPAITANSGETQRMSSAGAGSGAAAAPQRAGGKSAALDQFTVDLTARAREGKIDPVLGRDGEVRQIIDILSRRRQNNPILTGEAGVGKTAVVEGFALRVASGDVPPELKNVAIRSLDLGLLQAGAGVKGEFENRLRSVIDEVKGSAQPIIMFIDEAHTLIGAGGQAGQNDAANLLKPALARGELRTIAATTWAEYKKYFEKDPALTRRFQVVKVDEPSEAVAIEMLRGLVDTLETHHKIRVLDEGIVEAVRLSHRYIPDRQMPDKCVSVIDTACARVALSQKATPAPVEDVTRRLQQLDVAMGILEREMLTGAQHETRLGELREEKEAQREKLESLELQWSRERELTEKARGLRAKLEGAPNDGAAGDKKKTEDKADLAPAESETKKQLDELRALDEQLRNVQGQSPLMHVCVDAQAVAEVIAGWTGIPVGRMVSDEIRSVLDLADSLGQRVVGQSHALEAIARSIRTSRAKLTDPNKPIGVFLMVGTSGVGKTETALALADLLYGGEQNLTTINMSEFKEEHKVSLLLGSPPGYVGYGEGGVLTEAVRRKPYSVVLLDEMEKAHPGVQDIFYQAFDKGMMKDGEGRDIDFKNCIIIMTSNLGTDTITKLCADPETMPDAEGLLEAVRPDLLSYFKPAFLGRVNVVPYFPLHEDVMQKIIELKLGKIVRRVRENYQAELKYMPTVVAHIASRCRGVDSGARTIDNILEGSLLPQLAAECLATMAEGKVVAQAVVDVNVSGGLVVTVS
jgi:type VI secretion system protein VasG